MYAMSKRWLRGMITGFEIKFLLIGRLLFLVSVFPKFLFSLVSGDLMAFFLSAARHYIAPSNYLFYHNIRENLSIVSAEAKYP